MDRQQGDGRVWTEVSATRLTVANEFADVVVRLVASRNGVRLEISSPRRGTAVQLDAVELDCLSYQPPETFTAMLRQTPSA